MKFIRLTTIALCAASIFAAAQASAFSEDDKSMNDASGAPRFSDPDEKTPGGAVFMQGGRATSDAVDPSSVHYNYDASSGSYVPSTKQ